VLLFLVSGGIPLFGSRRRRRKEVDGGRGEPRVPAGGSPGRAAVESGDDDLADVRDILKKHGIS
jgi:hypothetical protein